jgi:hypothetical protein
MASKNVWNMSLFEHFFQGFKPLFGSYDTDPHPHQAEKSDSHLHQIKIRIPIK